MTHSGFSAILSRATGKFKAGDLVVAKSIDGLFQCIHEHCHKAFSDESVWLGHVESYHPSEDLLPNDSLAISVTALSDVGALKTGLTVDVSIIGKQLACPHDGCDAKFSVVQDWCDHIEFVEPQMIMGLDNNSRVKRGRPRPAPNCKYHFKRLLLKLTFIDVTATFPRDIGEFKAGGMASSKRENGEFLCPHVNCGYKTGDYYVWYKHVVSVREHAETISVALAKHVGTFKRGEVLQCSLIDGAFKCSHHNCGEEFQMGGHWIAHVQNEHSTPSSLSPKYSSNKFILATVCHLDESLYSLVFASKSEIILKYEHICNHYFQSRYNILFTDTMKSIRETFFGPLPSRALLREYKAIFTLWITTTIKLEDCFELHSSIEERLRDVRSSIEESDMKDARIQDTLTPMQDCLKSLHSLVNNIIVDSKSLTIGFSALALMLLDGVENGVQIWKPAEKAKKIVDGLMYSVRLVVLSNLQTSSIKHTSEYVEEFFGPNTKTLVELLDSLDLDLKN